MGNQPVLDVLAQMAETHPEVKFTQIVLAAPDVDRKQFAEIAHKVAPIAKNLTLYASARDEAMIVSRRIHSGLPRAGDVPPEGPVVLRGLDTIDATALSTEVFSTSHSKYAEDTSLLKDIGLLMRNAMRPPDVRTPSFARRSSGALEYCVSVGAGTP